MKSIRYKIRAAKTRAIMRAVDAALKGMDRYDKSIWLKGISRMLEERLEKLCPHGIADPSDCAVCCGLRKEEAA
jgi:hypothetical protein